MIGLTAWVQAWQDHTSMRALSLMRWSTCRCQTLILTRRLSSMRVLADFAMVLCGYGAGSRSHRRSCKIPGELFGGLGGPGRPRTISGLWNGLSCGRGSLYEKYGNTFIKKLFNEQKNGISGINAALASFGTPRRFADLYRDFSVAMLIDWSMNNYQYGFKNEDFKIEHWHPECSERRGILYSRCTGLGYRLYLAAQEWPNRVIFDGEDSIIRDTPW